MPDSQTPTPFRLALCPEGRSTNAQWLADDHPAQILLHVDQSSTLPTAWTFLSEFGLRDIMLHRREHPRRVGRGMDITSARLSLFNERDDELLICTAVGTPLTTHERAILGGICLLASGGLGTALEAVAQSARMVEANTAKTAAMERERADKDVLTIEPFLRTLTKALLPASAKVDLSPKRYDGGPTDLTLGNLSLRAYDRETHELLGMLATVGAALQASGRAIFTGGGK